MTKCNKQSLETLREGLSNSNVTEDKEILQTFFDNLKTIIHSFENQDLELLSTTIINIITLLDEIDYFIPKQIAEFPIFSQLFSLIQNIEDSTIQAKILEFLSNLYDKTDDTSIECDFIFSNYSSLNDLYEQVIDPIILQNDYVFGMFVNFLRSITCNIEEELLKEITKHIILSIYERSQFLLSSSQDSFSSLPQTIDYFAAFINSILYKEIFVIDNEEEELSDEMKYIDNILTNIVYLYFQNISCFQKPDQILHILYFFIDDHNDQVSVFLNKSNEHLIYKFLDFTQEISNSRIQTNEQILVATSLVELLNLSLEITKDQFFEMFSYPFEIIFNDIAFILANNKNSSKYIKFLDICFDFLINSIAYNQETVQEFISLGFLNFLDPISENFPYKIRVNSTDFFYNIIFSCKQWSDREIFIENEFFAKSLLDISKHQGPIINRILSLIIVCLE